MSQGEKLLDTFLAGLENGFGAEAMRAKRLLESAPALLAALERLTACPDVSLDECEQETYGALNQAREAIAAATGE